MKSPKSAGSMPRLAGTSAYLVVWTKCCFAVSAASAGFGCAAANVSIAAGQRALRLGRRQDGAVRAGADAGHAADALVGDELRDQRREAAEVAGGGRCRGDQAARHAHVGRQLDIGDAAAIRVYDGRVEVFDVSGDVEGLRRDSPGTRGKVGQQTCGLALSVLLGGNRFCHHSLSLRVLSQPRPHEVAGRDDSDRGGRRVRDDEAVDSALTHQPRGLVEARGRGDGQRRLGHDFSPTGQAPPVRRKPRVRLRPE